jgi:hypothetical protein
VPISSLVIAERALFDGNASFPVIQTDERTYLYHALSLFPGVSAMRDCFIRGNALF